MAKANSPRGRRLRLKELPPVRIHKKFQPFQRNAMLAELLTAPGRVQRPGALVVHSGVARHSSSAVVVDPGVAPSRSTKLKSFLSSEVNLGPGWGWSRFSIPAPLQGEVVQWVTLEYPLQWWSFSSFPYGPNESGHYQYVPFGLTWRWMLLPDLTVVPGAPASMQDGARYEFHASQPPGGTTWTAWWVEPSRSVTLTPYGKESDPNALSLLLATEYGGYLHLMFAYQFPWLEITFNGKPYTGGAFIEGGPETLFYSYGVLVPPKADPSPPL